MYSLNKLNCLNKTLKDTEISVPPNNIIQSHCNKVIRARISVMHASILISVQAVTVRYEQTTKGLQIFQENTQYGKDKKTTEGVKETKQTNKQPKTSLIQEKKRRNRETVTQSQLYRVKLSQKKKNKQHILAHMYGLQKNDTDETICRTGVETPTYRTDLQTQGEQERVGQIERVQLK